MKRINLFEKFLNEAKETSPKMSFRDHEMGIVVTIFFDHTKNKNNQQSLWNKVIKLIENSDCTFVDYSVTDSVCELVCYPKQIDPTDSIKKINDGLKSMEDMFTNSDVYFTE